MPRPNDVNLKSFYTTIMKTDPLFYAHQFVVTFTGPDLPDILKAHGGSDTNDFTYYVKSASIPTVEIEETTVAFLSQQFKLPRQVKYGETWDVKVLLDQNLRHYRSLYDWQNEFSSLQLSGGGRKVIPSVQAHVGLLDSSLQNVIHRFTLDGIFPTNIPDLSMQYQNKSDIVDFNCTFTYQYLYDDDYDDPLRA